MSKVELSKTYEANKVEDNIYKIWEESGFFAPDNLKKAKTPFTIAMPPPNVTGILHLGHAFENALMDIAIRYQRMKGKKALLIPGTDHAAVATQAKVEDELKKQGIQNPRQELGREKLLEKIREYAENSKAIILSQIKKMGTSCDWSRLAYTFDETRSQAVNVMFKKMFDDGLIYRGYRVINWSVKGQSTASDDELVYIEQPTKVYTFKYSSDFPIPLATTRPETKLGDTAVAVHPDDERYKKYIGQKFIVDVGAKNLLAITVIADKNVDPNYGTGAVGVTPAHSPIDFEMYQNNKNIGLIQVIGTDGKMTEAAGPAYQGLTALEAREKFVDWLKKNNLYLKEEEIVHSVGTSDRFGDVVEALPMEQWFIDVNKPIKPRNKSLKDLMREAVTVGHNGDKNKKIIIIPERFQKIYLHWIDNLRDWNISRQIWWGHQIPVWYCRGKDRDKCFKECHQPIVSEEKPKKCPVCGSRDLVQDEDTLDTWFSSGTWTFSILGWPKKTKDLKNYHPTAWMQMGYEILFFWLARMILMSTYALDEIPFREVYIHGILRDKNGRKFSKSTGNGPDPLEIIKQYGADALRLSLIKGITAGNDARFYEEKVEAARNFVNKLWNISRFIFNSVSEIKIIDKAPKVKTLADKWLLTKLENIKSAVETSLDNYEFSYASELLYNFTWSDFADWYIEVYKVESKKLKGNEEILLYTLQNLLKLWHPFCPFVTEEIWHHFSANELLMVAKWPSAKKKEANNNKILADFELVKNLITAIRNLRSENKIEPKKKIKVIIYASDKIKIVKSQAELIKNFWTNIETLEIKKSGQKPANCLSAVAGGCELYLDLTGIIDLEAEKSRLIKEIEGAEKYLKSLEGKLANQEFVSQAPQAVVEKEKEKLVSQKVKLDKLKNQLNNLK
ncbi:MAG: valine--tRNA ligase [Candidatus Buchananbacteria bacterium RIFCSPHIGHO2_02_FULL_40_13]|uniref:Valine--tRNA ligase n=1 Tax=Candidatus Buchananbacteria bacterium RIFCSPLOWO2_01_FULL_39_33 TaxID=1797543 RepID=A0A1G1YH34_9BACT|nr:MAG: valine--tRNA ligase [Candidatus Buchananbacteria bacterium RIFCSPHIGHO2_01_FULL_40_35]OGY49512.1 MAG: valine--tRNA ligase [Candidatus Buchananbacteria bacterium RIFCSPHIGHO2_02_FULL_40_13]OGY51665.1 MAG: valine--tRNA ligase [Candidatus Buchananbacteria bacterium RIFCSPLOWO2_01_FULL_39_33]